MRFPDCAELRSCRFNRRPLHDVAAVSHSNPQTVAGSVVAGRSRCREFGCFGEFLDTIAHTIQRLDHIEVDVASLEFLAQPLDVAIDGSVVDIHLVVVSSIHQGVAAFHDPRSTRQRLQDEKFGDCESYRRVFPCAGVALRVHTQ
jgi:hypothetical protein